MAERHSGRGRQRPIKVSRFQAALDDSLLTGANIIRIDGNERRGAPIPKLSFSRLEQIGRLLDYPDEIVGATGFIDQEGQVRILKGNSLHTIQMLAQIWRSIVPLPHSIQNRISRGFGGWDYQSESYLVQYRQNLHNIGESLPTVRPELIQHFIALLDDERLAFPAGHDERDKRSRQSSYRIIAERVMEDIKTRYPFTDTQAMDFGTDMADEFPFSDPWQLEWYWQQMGAHKDILRQTDNIFSHHEDEPFMTGMTGHGSSGMEVRFHAFLPFYGFRWSGRMDEISIEEERLGQRTITITDYKSHLPEIPSGGREQDALLVSLCLTAQAARALTRDDLMTQGTAISLEERDLRGQHDAHVSIRYMSFDTYPPSEIDFSEWEPYWNDDRYKGYMDDMIHGLVTDISQNYDRLAPLFQ